MANVLDLRRRIRSVKNTRQITKAMKMVSAAKLRRAQERAMLARPYAQMLTNVLESLVRRTDLYNDADRRCHASAAGRARREERPRRRHRRRQGLRRRASTRTSSRPRRASSTSAAPGPEQSTWSRSARKAVDLFARAYPGGRLREEGRALRQRSRHAL